MKKNQAKVSEITLRTISLIVFIVTITIDIMSVAQAYKVLPVLLSEQANTVSITLLLLLTIVIIQFLLQFSKNNSRRFDSINFYKMGIRQCVWILLVSAIVLSTYGYIAYNFQ